MPGIVTEEIHEEGLSNESNGKSPIVDHGNDLVEETSIEQLYENVCDMQSSDQSPSRQSFGSDGEESRIDSELRHLAGGEMREVEIMEEEVEVCERHEDDCQSNSSFTKGNLSSGKNSNKLDKTKSATPKSTSSTPKEDKSPLEKPPINNLKGKKVRKSNAGIASLQKQTNLGVDDLDNPDLGLVLLKQAKDLISSGDNFQKALELALRATKSLEVCANGKPSLDLVMCLHVTAAIHCSLSQYHEAISVLMQSIDIPVLELGQEHALAKFTGHMQLGDTFAMLGQLENSIRWYTMGLELQKQVLGDLDPRVGETCRYLAEAHLQALNFDEAERLCQMALDIHRENVSLAPLEEAADRRLMGLICETKGNHETALEHLVLCSMAMVANGQESGVAPVDSSIGDIYLSLSRYDEAIIAYQKAVAAFKATKGEHHPTVGSVFVRMADLYNKTGKLRQAKLCSENALEIYEKPMPGIVVEEIASGFTDIAAIYESMNEPELAIRMLSKALDIYNGLPGQQMTIAGIEAQMGIIYCIMGNHSESYGSLSKAISKFRAGGDKKPPFFGIALNQMGVVCVQRSAINEAVEMFEEAKSILEQEYGPYHPETLGVYSNLAGTYDALGRLDKAFEMLEYVVEIREEKLGTANPEVSDEKKRLAELLKEAGRVGRRKTKSLETLLDANSNAHEVTVDDVVNV